MGRRGEFTCLWEWERSVSSGNTSTIAWLMETWTNPERHLISPESEWNGPVWNTGVLLLLQDLAHGTRSGQGSQENSTERKLLLRKGNMYTLQAKWSHCIFCSLQPQIFIKGIKKSHQAAEKTKRDIHVLEPAFSIIKYHRGWWRSGAASLRITTNLEAKLVRNARSMWKRTNLLSHWH